MPPVVTCGHRCLNKKTCGHLCCKPKPPQRCATRDTPSRQATGEHEYQSHSASEAQVYNPQMIGYSAQISQSTCEPRQPLNYRSKLMEMPVPQHNKWSIPRSQQTLTQMRDWRQYPPTISRKLTQVTLKLNKFCISPTTIK